MIIGCHNCHARPGPHIHSQASSRSPNLPGQIRIQWLSGGFHATFFSADTRGVRFDFSVRRPARNGPGQDHIQRQNDALSSVYAWKALDYDGKRVKTHLLLSAEKVPDAALADDFAKIDLGKAGKLHGVEVEFNAEGDIVSGTFYTDAKDGYFSASGMHNFEKKAMTPTSIEGRLSMEKEDDFGGVRYFYDAMFKTPIAPVHKAK